MAFPKTNQLLDAMIRDLESSLGVAPSKGATGNASNAAKAPESAAPPSKAEDAAPKGGDAPKKEKSEKAAEKKEKTESKPAAAEAPKAAAEGDQVGVMTKTWAHPESEKLFCEEIDVGEGAVRSVASGLRAFYSLEQFCPGRKVVVVTNLKPAKMAGFESQGMVMAASAADHSKVVLLEPPADAKVGERIFIEGLTGEAYNPNQVQKKKVLPAVLADLKTDGSGVACWQGRPLLTSAGPLKAPGMPNMPIA